MGVIRQLELVKKMQAIWSDNSVSVTAYYAPEELEIIKDWLKENYEHHVKSVSFLLRKEHGFKQMPYEEITEEVYRKMANRVNPLALMGADGVAGNMLEGMECEGGACPLR